MEITITLTEEKTTTVSTWTAVACLEGGPEGDGVGDDAREASTEALADLWYGVAGWVGGGRGD